MISKILDTFDYPRAISIYSDLFGMDLSEDDFRELIMNMWEKTLSTLGDVQEEYFVDVTADNFIYLQTTFYENKPININIFCKILEANAYDDQYPYQPA